MTNDKTLRAAAGTAYQDLLAARRAVETHAGWEDRAVTDQRRAAVERMASAYESAKAAYVAACGPWIVAGSRYVLRGWIPSQTVRAIECCRHADSISPMEYWDVFNETHGFRHIAHPDEMVPVE